jgi:hypothetical protein
LNLERREAKRKEEKRASHDIGYCRRTRRRARYTPAWHFVCVARAQSFKKARESVLAIVPDARVPMPQLYDLLASGPRLTAC